jgi:hypothetical protein
LVEPGGIGRGEVKLNVWVVGEEGFDGFGLVSREVIRDDVFLPRG